MDEKMVNLVLRMLNDRAEYWEKRGHQVDIEQEDTYFARAGAYASARDILQYALDGNLEAVNQFDTYHGLL